MARVFWLTLFFATGIAVGLGACSSFSEEDGTDAGDAAEIDTSQGADTSDAPPIGDAAAESDGTYASPLVHVGDNGYSIEVTEVTIAQFNKFKRAFKGDAGVAWAECPGKKALTTGCSPNGSDDTPMTCVDFCDAQAYCHSIGRRVCGHIGGGSQNINNPTDRATDQWFQACVGASGANYAYDGGPKVGVCNTSDLGKKAAVPAGQLPDCVGPEPGLLHMNGNVAEWEDACNNNTCVVRGGSFNGDVAGDNCSAAISGSAGTAFFTDVGIRCCLDDP